MSIDGGVRTETRDGVLEVTIDRPKANAISQKTSLQLNEIWTSFQKDPALRIAILTGAGEKFFSPGWDLKGAMSRAQKRLCALL